MKKFSLVRYGNCLMFLLYLYFTRRLDGILIRWDNNDSWPHFLGYTKRHNMIHLTNRKIKDKKRNCSPIFIYGQPELFRREYLRKAKYSVIFGHFCKDVYEFV